jgi:hypothetical protein
VRVPSQPTKSSFCPVADAFERSGKRWLGSPEKSYLKSEGADLTETVLDFRSFCNLVDSMIHRATNGSLKEDLSVESKIFYANLLRWIRTYPNDTQRQALVSWIIEDMRRAFLRSPYALLCFVRLYNDVFQFYFSTPRLPPDFQHMTSAIPVWESVMETVRKRAQKSRDRHFRPCRVL